LTGRGRHPYKGGMGRGEDVKTSKRKAETSSTGSRRSEAVVAKEPPPPPAPSSSDGSRFTPNQESHGYVVGRVTLRKWFWDRIEEEGKALGAPKRSERSTFLNAMVRRKGDSFELERAKSRPQWQFPSTDELGPEELYAWNMPLEVKAILDTLLEPLGDLPLKAWVILSLFEWLGLTEFPDARRKKT
jgi:hypothetical protein